METGLKRWSCQEEKKKDCRGYTFLIAPNSRITQMKARINPNTKLVLPELSYTIMGILFTVHNELGPLILEKYYQRAVAKELSSERLKFTREIRVIHKLDS